MIAIALACDPEVLIADEPTTAHDVTIQAQILELVHELRRKLDMAIILITHDLGVIAGIADPVIVMYGGQVVKMARCASCSPARATPRHPRSALIPLRVLCVNYVGDGIRDALDPRIRGR